MDFIDQDDLHLQLKERKCKILDEMWKYTQKYLDQNLKDCMECIEEIELIKKLESTDDFKTLLGKLDAVKEEINIFYIDYLEQNCKSNLKKDKIMALKGEFQDEISTLEIVNAVNCSKNYARQFYVIEGQVLQKEKRSSLSKKTKDSVLKRDNNSCMACGCTKSLEIHHIMPIMGSSIKELNDSSNLVTLCNSCHYLAHSSDIMYRYMTEIIKEKMHHQPLDHYKINSK